MKFHLNITVYLEGTEWLRWMHYRTNRAVICKLISTLNVWSGVFQWLFFVSCSLRLSPPLANWGNNRGTIIERGRGGEEGNVLPDLHFLGLCCLRHLGASLHGCNPYMGFAWNRLWWSLPAAKVLKRHNTFIHNWTLHGGWERASAQKRVSSFTFLHHRASGCLGLFLDR